MAASIGPKKDPFVGLGPDPRQIMRSFLTFEEMAKSAQVSQLFQKLMDDPKIWIALGTKFNFKVNPQKPKEDFIAQFESRVNEVIIGRFFKHVKPNLVSQLPVNQESISKLPWTEQRAAIEKLIASQKFKLEGVDLQAPAAVMDGILFNLLDKISNNLLLESPFDPQDEINKHAALVFLKNGVPGNKKLIDKISLFHAGFYKAYLEGKLKREESLHSDLRDVLENLRQRNPECMNALLEIRKREPQKLILGWEEIGRAIALIAWDKTEPGKYSVPTETLLRPMLEEEMKKLDAKDKAVLAGAQTLAETLIKDVQSKKLPVDKQNIEFEKIVQKVIKEIYDSGEYPNYVDSYG